jgi:hypothetical protein
MFVKERKELEKKDAEMDAQINDQLPGLIVPEDAVFYGPAPPPGGPQPMQIEDESMVV